MSSSGFKGSSGEKGEQGEKGEAGTSIHMLEGAPSAEEGAVGDVYINKQNGHLYGPKTKSNWPYCGSIVGLEGPQGLTGAQGEKGATGSQGAQGVEGPKGSTGSIGATGAQGLAGEKGTTGSTGLEGPRGLTGATGAIGPEGPKGATGSQGTQGIEGPKGSTGSTGATGPTGSTGTTGATGEKGAAGSTGATGPGAILGEWKSLSLGTNIANKGTPYANAECSKDSLGLVYLRGVIKSTAILALNVTVATLPEGYKPAKQQLISTNLGGSIGLLTITTEGKIQISIGVGLEALISFDSVFFPLV